jgi:hypothetical protein
VQTHASESPAAEPATPLLSLCLATYNRARYLDRYLTHHLTALEAAGIDYELVVSDNCSTDETPQILARYAARHPRMRVMRQPRNMGAHANILASLHLARGEVAVSIADDDLAVPHQLLAYVQRMAADPALVMIQAPWLLMDETKDGSITGQFYTLPGETRLGRGAYGDCLAFLIQHHVFPECALIRRSALPSIAGPASKFVYGYFAMLAHALGKGDVLFAPEPHVTVTAVSAGDNGHQGNTEAMESWDGYRGGLEMLASYARQANPAGWADAAAVGQVIQNFVCERMGVAARLQAHARNWSNAYLILRRLHAYDQTPAIDYAYDDVAVLAAVESAFLECVQRGAEAIVLGDSIADHVLQNLRPVEGARLIRVDAVAPEDGRRAYCSIGGEPDPSMREGDFCFDIVMAIDRFPFFPPGSG